MLKETSRLNQAEQDLGAKFKAVEKQIANTHMFIGSPKACVVSSSKAIFSPNTSTRSAIMKKSNGTIISLLIDNPVIENPRERIVFQFEAVADGYLNCGDYFS